MKIHYFILFIIFIINHLFNISCCCTNCNEAYESNCCTNTSQEETAKLKAILESSYQNRFIKEFESLKKTFNSIIQRNIEEYENKSSLSENIHSLFGLLKSANEKGYTKIANEIYAEYEKEVKLLSKYFKHNSKNKLVDVDL